MFEKSTKHLKLAKDVLIPIIDFEQTVIKSADGVYLYDCNDNMLLDVNGGQFSNIFGYNNKDFNNFIKNSLTKSVHINTGMLSEQVINSMNLLCNTAKEMDPKGITLSTGSEAIEFAIRYAKKGTRKNGVISFSSGYHGLTLGSQSLTYGGKFALPLVNQTYQVEFNNDNQDKIVSDLEYILVNNNDISCFVIEPFLGVGGMYPIKESVLKDIKEVCEKYGVLLIFDECQSGFGRTGKWYYYQQVNVVPDVLVVAKGIGNGFPVSAVLIKNDTLEKYPYNLTNYSSHQNDPISADIIEFGINKVGSILNSIEEKGIYFREELVNLKSNHIKNVRGMGLMVGFDLEQDLIDSRTFYKIFKLTCLENGLVIQGTNEGKVIRFLPAYVISTNELDEVITKLEISLNQSINEAKKNV
ncbi:MAG: aminotransferase class III-fold pyridoxal phosphate-dependent enzyme [Anaerorhabdus sp.]